MKRSTQQELKVAALRGCVQYRAELQTSITMLDVLVARLALKLERARTLGLADMAAESTARVATLQQAIKALEMERHESVVFEAHLLQGPRFGDRKN